ncbi:hypothetical protein [Arthrobacter sp. NPDC057009]|uniref:hypothetical protein n=1 Tax=Arthrobacter sp. NPDC057009 TaxID=3345996 RepID=UPI003631FFA5
MRRKVSPALALWLVLIALVNLLSGFGMDWQTVQFTLGALGILFCASGFWADGKQRITAPGIALFTAGLFIFFPGCALLFDKGLGLSDVSLVPALNIAFVTHLLWYYLAWKPRPQTEVVVQPVDPKVAQWGMWMGLLMLGSAVAASQTSLAANPFVEGAAYLGIVLFALSALRREKKIVFVYVVIGLAFLAYMEFIFSGFGRIKLGSLALALALLASHRWGKRAVKAGLLVGIVPGLAYLAASRAEFTATLNPNQADNVTGLGSVIGPAARFAQLLDMNTAGELTYTWGQTFFSSLVSMVPREVWPTKPVGFGAELADLFRPDLAGSGHSELALFYGEWVYGFGVLGLVLMVPVYGWFVNRLDGLLVNRQPTAVSTISGLLMLATVTILGASIVDLLWGGTFTYASRVGPRLIIIAALWAAFGWSLPKAKPLPVPPRGRQYLVRKDKALAHSQG